MKATLETRISFIITLFVAFGSILINLINIENASYNIASFAMLLSLMSSFVLSLFFINRLTKKRRKNYALLGLFLLILSFVSFFIFQNKLNNNIVEIEQFQNDSTLVKKKYFKGVILKQGELGPVEYKKNFPKSSDQQLVEAFNNDVDNVWEQQSIWTTQLYLSFFYFIFVVSSVLCISLSTEILTVNTK